MVEKSYVCRWHFDDICHSFCYVQLLVNFEIAAFEIAMVDSPRLQLKRNKFDVSLSKRLGLF